MNDEENEVYFDVVNKLYWNRSYLAIIPKECRYSVIEWSTLLNAACKTGTIRYIRLYILEKAIKTFKKIGQESQYCACEMQECE